MSAITITDIFMVIGITLFAGGTSFIGAIIGKYIHFSTSVLLFLTAFGAGILIAAAIFEMVIQAEKSIGLIPTLVFFIFGAIIFTIADVIATRKGGGADILIGIGLDTIPESLAIGASIASGSAFAIALLIRIQNIPEGIAAFAVSAVDMALWDLKGKALGLPVCQLLGGMLHNKVVAMGSIIFDMEDFEWTLNEFRWMREEGYFVVKAGWGMRPEAVFGQDRQKDLEIVREVRGVIGDKLELVVDTPGARGIWDVPTAIQRFRDLEPYRLKWIEQPLPPQDLEGHARLRTAVATPIGTGEDEWNTESYRRLIQSKGVDVIQMDPGRCHGITGCRDVIKLIEAENLQFSAHTWSSALNTAASVHLLAISTQGSCMDFKPHESPMQHELVSDPWVQENGYLRVRSSPGLGVTVLEEVVRKYLLT
jgi:L-alanine-DL-glutamate epimerase-like enolase superfamily enzyme